MVCAASTVRPPNNSDDLCLLFCLFPSSMMLNLISPSLNSLNFLVGAGAVLQRGAGLRGRFKVSFTQQI